MSEFPDAKTSTQIIADEKFLQMSRVLVSAEIHEKDMQKFYDLKWVPVNGKTISSLKATLIPFLDGLEKEWRMWFNFSQEHRFDVKQSMDAHIELKVAQGIVNAINRIFLGEFTGNNTEVAAEKTLAEIQRLREILSPKPPKTGGEPA